MTENILSGTTCAEAMAAIEDGTAAVQRALNATPDEAEAPDEQAKIATSMRLPSEYMRPGMRPWTVHEAAYIEQRNAEAGR